MTGQSNPLHTLNNQCFFSIAHIKNQEGQSMKKPVNRGIWCVHGLPLWIISNPQGQEYGSSAVRGAVLNLQAVCVGRHHCGHTPWWPGAQHMVGCWEYTAMRPCRLREPCMPRYTGNIPGGMFHNELTNTKTIQNKHWPDCCLESKVPTDIKNQEGQSMKKPVNRGIWCVHGLPLWIISNPQGQEYGSSAVRGAVLNLQAVCVGRHHCGHTPWWPGAQHMVGCWEYTAMRPCRLREPCMPRYTGNIPGGMFHNELTNTKTIQNKHWPDCCLESKVPTDIKNDEKSQSIVEFDASMVCPCGLSVTHRARNMEAVPCKE